MRSRYATLRLTAQDKLAAKSAHLDSNQGIIRNDGST